MNLYFFRPVPVEFRSEFVIESARRNRIVVRIAALIVMIMSSSALLSVYFVDYSTLPQLNELQNINRSTFSLSAIAFALTYVLHIGTPAKRTALRVLNVVYPMCIMIAMMWVSLIAMHNARNTMTMYTLGAISVGMLWMFSVTETLCIMTVCEIVFSVAIARYQDNPMEIVLNQFMSVFLLTVFFFLSRWNFSMQFNHFRQLKVIGQKSAELEKLSEAKSEILGVVAHDLRTPLSNVEMLASMTLDELDGDSDVRENLEMILTSCRNGRSTINDLIDLANDRNETIQVMEKVKMQDFLQSVRENWKYQMGGDRTLTISQPETPLFAEIHEDKLRRVLDNLISNAIKFTQIDGRIHIELSETGNQIQINVNDDGIGIPQTLLPYLFDRFSKAGRSGLQGQASVGLGLSISKKFVHEQRGTIRVRNNERGTTFSVALPSVPAPAKNR
ncbi:MAG: HAMP domain-containing histidine kinase [Mucilaginibacter polytrichastri]|nr:HAMP domain-containing histidine kinase [Mucilaginibacter polytrichastri]